MHGEIRHIRNLNHKPEHINEIINILFPLHRIQQFAIWFCWSVFFLCSSSMFWSTSYNYHRTLNESSSIWLVFTSTLECIELLESSNKPFIIERIHFHRKLFRSFFFTFLLTHILVVSFICFVSAETTLKHIWYLECCKRYGRIPMNTLNWWRRPRQKKNATATTDILSEMRCQAFICTPDDLNDWIEPLFWFPYNIW